MNLVITGFAPREEAVLGFFLSRTLPSWQWQSAPPDPQAALPKADLYLADLAALGLARGSEAGAARLLQLLQDTPAVLLVSANDRSWAALPTVANRASLVWLAKPYGTQAMQAALEQAAATVRQAAPLAPPPPAPAQVAPALPVEEAHSLTAEHFKVRLDALQELSRYVFLRQLSAMLTKDRPFEARFTVQNSLIVHPADGWIATNTPRQVIESVCRSDAMASAVSMREIDSAQAEERAQRLGMPPSELDIFLAELVAVTLDKLH